MSNLTDKELNQAQVALRNWFQSQDISPGDAGIIMIQTIAALLVEKDKNLRSLQQAIGEFDSLLMIEVAGNLKGWFKS